MLPREVYGKVVVVGKRELAALVFWLPVSEEEGVVLEMIDPDVVDALKGVGCRPSRMPARMGGCERAEVYVAV